MLMEMLVKAIENINNNSNYYKSNRVSKAKTKRELIYNFL